MKLRKERMLKILNDWIESSLALNISKPNNLQNMMFLNLWVKNRPIIEANV